MNVATPISPTPERIPAEDFELLRREGIEHLRKLSHRVWDDHNIHDPGITILELLAYALNDLAYRTNFNTTDILTPDGKDAPDEEDVFFSARKILTTRAVTINDYRRLVMDRVPGIRNVWLSRLNRLDKDGVPLDIDIDEPLIYCNGATRKITTILPSPGSIPITLHGLYRVKYEQEPNEVYLGYLDTEVYRQFLENHLYPLTGSNERLEIFKYSADLNNDNVDEQYIKISHFTAQNVESIVIDALSTTVLAALKQETLKYLRDLFIANRNLCEDFVDYSAIDVQEVGVCLDVELASSADQYYVYKEIYRLIYDYISPRLKFYSIEQLLDRGKKMEEIFEGIQPEKGFVDLDELNEYNFRADLYASDIISLIMDIPGVVAVHKLHMNSYISNYGQVDFEEQYCLHLQDPQNYTFKFVDDFEENSTTAVKNKISFFKNGLRLPFDKSKNPYTLADVIGLEDLLLNYETDLPMPTGKNRHLDRYYSIQNEFPDNYALGHDGLPQQATTKRRSQRLQLKGYLLHFEQLLADYLAQLNNVKGLLSWDDTATEHLSYYFQQLDNNEIADLNMLINDFQAFQSTQNARAPYSIDLLESDDLRQNRLTRLLDHMLARFNESFVDYSLMSFSHRVYLDVFTSQSQSGNSAIIQEIITDKKTFLKNYELISREREEALNYAAIPYTLPSGNNQLFKVSGFERKVMYKLGINRSGQQGTVEPWFNLLAENLGVQHITVNGNPETHYYFADTSHLDFDESFGFHIIEHILLRPKASNLISLSDYDDALLHTCVNDHNVTDPAKLCFCTDPYSFKVTVVLPGWHAVSQNSAFRQFVEQVLREEAPAHVALKICWVDPIQMFEFEQAYIRYMPFLRNIHEGSTFDTDDYLIYLECFTKTIGSLKNMYPAAYLLDDCEDLEYSEDGVLTSSPVILGRTILGGQRKTYHFIKDADSAPDGWFYSGGGQVYMFDEPGIPSGWTWPATQQGVPTWSGHGMPSGFMYNTNMTICDNPCKDPCNNQ